MTPRDNDPIPTDPTPTDPAPNTPEPNVTPAPTAEPTPNAEPAAANKPTDKGEPETEDMPDYGPLSSDWYNPDDHDWASYRNIYDLHRAKKRRKKDVEKLLHIPLGCLRDRLFFKEVKAWKAIRLWIPATDPDGFVSQDWLATQARHYPNRLRQVKATLWAMAKGPRMTPMQWTYRIAAMCGDVDLPPDWADWWNATDITRYRRRRVDMASAEEKSEYQHGYSYAYLTEDMTDVAALPGERRATTRGLVLAILAALALTAGYIALSLRLMGSYLSFGMFDVPPLYYLLGNGNNIDGPAPEWFSDLLIGIGITVALLGVDSIVIAPVSGLFRVPRLTYFLGICAYLAASCLCMMWSRLGDAYFQEAVLPRGQTNFKQLEQNVAFSGSFTYTLCTVRGIAILAVIMLSFSAVLSALALRRARARAEGDTGGAYKAARAQWLVRSVLAGLFIAHCLAVHPALHLDIGGSHTELPLLCLVVGCFALFYLIPNEFVAGASMVNFNMRARAVITYAYWITIEAWVGISTMSLALFTGVGSNIL